MKITLILYAILREKISENPLEFEVKDNMTAAELMQELAGRYPEVKGILQCTRLAHQEDYVEKNKPLRDGGEYCLIPPVSGG